jgi:hypothetical protein
MDKSSFPVAAKAYAALLDHPLGGPFLPNKSSPPAQIENLNEELRGGGFLK